MKLTVPRVMAVLLVALSATVAWEGYLVLAIPAPSTSTVIEPGSLVKNCSWTIYTDGTTILANYGGAGAGSLQGSNVYSGTDFGNIFDSVINNINSAGGTICFGPSTFNAGYNLLAAANITAATPLKNLRMIGMGNGATTIMLAKAAPSLISTTTLATNFRISGIKFVCNGLNTADCIAFNNTGNTIWSDVNQYIGGTANFNALNIVQGIEFVSTHDIIDTHGAGTGLFSAAGITRIESGDFLGGGSGYLLFLGFTFATAVSNNEFTCGPTNNGLLLISNWNTTIVGNNLTCYAGIGINIQNTNYTTIQSNMLASSGAIIAFTTHVSSNDVITDNILHGPTPFSFSIPPTTGMKIKDNNGYNPVGKLANSINGAFIGICGTGTTIVSATVYVVCGTDITMTCSGGTVTAIAEKDNLGNQIFSVANCAALPVQGLYVPVGYSITWTHTGAPTVLVYAN